MYILTPPELELLKQSVRKFLGLSLTVRTNSPACFLATVSFRPIPTAEPAAALQYNPCIVTCKSIIHAQYIQALLLWGSELDKALLQPKFLLTASDYIQSLLPTVAEEKHYVGGQKIQSVRAIVARSYGVDPGKRHIKELPETKRLCSIDDFVDNYTRALETARATSTRVAVVEAYSADTYVRLPTELLSDDWPYVKELKQQLSSLSRSQAKYEGQVDLLVKCAEPLWRLVLLQSLFKDQAPSAQEQAGPLMPLNTPTGLVLKAWLLQTPTTKKFGKWIKSSTVPLYGFHACLVPSHIGGSIIPSNYTPVHHPSIAASSSPNSTSTSV